MRATRTVLVCGIPGVGKTTLIRSTLAHVPDAGFCEAQDLVMQANALDCPQTFSGSVVHRVARHYQLLAREFVARREQTPKRVMILESVALIETESGWFEPPLHVLKSIDPQALVHVEDDCDRIAQRYLRDRSTVRLTRSAIELARCQDRSLRACERQAERLGCALHRLRADACDELRHLIDSM
jgi:adenylate kinase